MNDPELEAAKQELYADVNLGREMEEFLNGNIGRYLWNCALDVINNARNELENVDEDDSETLRKAQMHAKAARLVMTWVNTAVENGKHATDTLMQEGG